MNDEGLWYRHSAMNGKTNKGLVFYFDSSAAANSKIIHRHFITLGYKYSHRNHINTDCMAYLKRIDVI